MFAGIADHTRGGSRKLHIGSSSERSTPPSLIRNALTQRGKSPRKPAIQLAQHPRLKRRHRRLRLAWSANAQKEIIILPMRTRYILIAIVLGIVTLGLVARIANP
jgi:hypothetical protein